MTETLPAVIEPTPLTLIQGALDKGADPEKLKALFDLASQYNRDRAAERFADALTRFQSEMPAIFKGRKAQGGKIGFAFASLDDIMRVAAPLLAKHRIAVTYQTEPIDRLLKVTCRVRVGTHVEESTVTLPIPQGTVNDAQLMGQAVTYGRRYALCAALGIVITDEDQDANGLHERASGEDLDALNDLLKETGSDVDRFLAWLGVKEPRDITKAMVPKALDALRRKKQKAGAA